MTSPETARTVSINIDERLFVEVIDTDSFGVSAARVLGDATHENPARFVALHRHADIADETPGDVTRAEAEQYAEEAARLLAGLSANTSADLNPFVEAVHRVVQGSGTYYSFLVVIASPTRVLAAGIGKVSLQLWSSGSEARPALFPTTLAVGESQILMSALGLGFDLNQIQTVDLSLAAGDRIIVGIDVDITTLQPTPIFMPRELLQHVIQSLDTTRSAIVGVIAGYR